MDNKFQTVIEKRNVRTFIDCLNPRTRESYEAWQMAEDIAAHDFRLLNAPVVLAVEGLGDWCKAFRPHNLALKAFMQACIILQGHRRIAGVLVILDNYEHFGFKSQKEAEDLLLEIDVAVMRNLTEADARLVAFDERFHKSLGQFEAVSEMVRLYYAGHDNRSVARHCGKIICESRMIGKGKAVWAEYTDMRSDKEKTQFITAKCVNVCNHVKYAVNLGPRVVEEVLKWYRRERDGLKIEDEVVAFDAKWTTIRDLSAIKEQSTSPWLGPIESWTYDEKGFIKDIVVGNEEVRNAIKQVVKDYIDPVQPVEKLNQKRREEIAETLTAPGLKEIALSLVKGEVPEGYREIDSKLRRICVIFSILEENFESVKPTCKDLVEALLGNPNAKEVADMFLTKPSEVKQVV